MKIIDNQGRVLHLGDLAVTGNLRLETPSVGMRWIGDDIQWAPAASNRLQLTSMSGAGSALELRALDGWTPQSFVDAAGLFSWTYETTTELWAEDSDGIASQLTSHAQDAPAWMYDADDPFPRILKELNVFIGKVRYTNASRCAKLMETLLAGGDLSGLPAERKRWVHEETFDQHNSRLGLSGTAQLKVQDWTEVQNRLQADYDANRERAMQRGEAPPPAADIRRPVPKWIADRLAAHT